MTAQLESSGTVQDAIKIDYEVIKRRAFVDQWAPLSEKQVEMFEKGGWCLSGDPADRTFENHLTGAVRDTPPATCTDAYSEDEGTFDPVSVIKMMLSCVETSQTVDYSVNWNWVPLFRGGSKTGPASVLKWKKVFKHMVEDLLQFDQRIAGADSPVRMMEWLQIETGINEMMAP